MGLKEMMDRHGRYITEDEVEQRVAEMEATRTALLTRAEYQNALKGNASTSGIKTASQH
jgi:hypothetical protein